jgi:AcrR family transcriptional regulator
MARTPSATAHKKVLKAALELVAESGVAATSMDAIAKKSGVSKATIYNHWADKDALLLDIMAELHGLHARPVFDSGDSRADMVAVLAYKPRKYMELRERILPHFVAYSASHAAFGLAWRNLVMDPPRNELMHLMKLAVEKRELRPGIDFNVSLALLLGPIIYWKVFLRSGDAPQGLAESVVDVFWKAFGVPKETSQASRHSTKSKM